MISPLFKVSENDGDFNRYVGTDASGYDEFHGGFGNGVGYGYWVLGMGIGIRCMGICY